MIVIKRNCSSSIRDDPLKDKITFGDFTIVISYEDHEAFDWLKIELKASPMDLLQMIILEGIDSLTEKYGFPVVLE